MHRYMFDVKFRENFLAERHSLFAVGLEGVDNVLGVIHGNIAEIPVEAALVSDDVEGRSSFDGTNVDAGVVGVEAIVRTPGGDQGVHFVFEPNNEAGRFVDGVDFLFDPAAVSLTAPYGGGVDHDAFLPDHRAEHAWFADDGSGGLFVVVITDGLGQEVSGHTADFLVETEGEIDGLFQARTQEQRNACQTAGEESLHVAAAPAVELVSLQREFKRVSIPWLADGGHNVHMSAQNDAAVYRRPNPAVDGFLSPRFVGNGLVFHSIVLQVLLDPVGNAEVPFSTEDGEGD